MILVVGEILYDIFPDEKRLGGAPFNFAFHLQKLGVDTRFVSRVGNDGPGRDILGVVESSGFDPDDIQVDPSHPTGYVNVHMDPGGEPSFEIMGPAAYDYLACNSRVKALIQRPPDLMYMGSLIQRSAHGQAFIKELAALKAEQTRLFCDINLRPDCWNEKSVATCLELADILKLNQEELYALTPAKLGNERYSSLCRHLMTRWEIQHLILTLGDRGSAFFTATRDVCCQADSSPVTVMDTVGAGDAYSAMAVACILKNYPISTTIELASAFAAQICSIKGALPSSDDVYKAFIHQLKR